MNASDAKVEIQEGDGQEACAQREETLRLLRRLDRVIAGLMVAILLTLAWPVCRALLPHPASTQGMFGAMVPGAAALNAGRIGLEKPS